MIYKKGSIVPRRIARCENRKTQHLWTFGADVEVNGGNILVLTEGVVIICKKGFIGGKKGKPKIINRTLIKDVNVVNAVTNGPVFGVTGE